MSGSGFGSNNAESTNGDPLASGSIASDAWSSGSNLAAAAASNPATAVSRASSSETLNQVTPRLARIGA